MGQRGFRCILISLLIIRIYMTSSSGLTIAINHASHFYNGQWLLLAGIAQYDGGDSTECTVCSGEGARGKILRQCTTLISGLGEGKITLHIYSLAFSSLLMTTALICCKVTRCKGQHTTRMLSVVHDRHEEVFRPMLDCWSGQGAGHSFCVWKSELRS